MSSTRKLFSILMCLITIMIAYFAYTNYENISSYVVKNIKKYTKEAVIVPKETFNHRIYEYKSVHETDNFEPKNIEELKDIYYTVLNNGWKTFTFYCPTEYENCLNDVKAIANGEEDNYITLINNYVSPYNSYRKYNTSILDDQVTLKVDKIYTDDDIKKLNNLIDTYISVAVNKSNIKLSDIEQIHDYLLRKITYDTKYQITDEITDTNKATGALINGTSLCSGYADTFAIFLDKLNIPNFRINSEEHEWNVIYFNNKWSHIDLTWDDDEINPNNNRNFFMISTNELLKKDKKDHTFNVNHYLELK